MAVFAALAQKAKVREGGACLQKHSRCAAHGRESIRHHGALGFEHAVLGAQPSVNTRLERLGAEQTWCKGAGLPSWCTAEQYVHTRLNSGKLPRRPGLSAGSGHAPWLCARLLTAAAAAAALQDFYKNEFQREANRKANMVRVQMGGSSLLLAAPCQQRAGWQPRAVGGGSLLHASLCQQGKNHFGCSAPYRTPLQGSLLLDTLLRAFLPATPRRCCCGQPSSLRGPSSCPASLGRPLPSEAAARGGAAAAVAKQCNSGAWRATGGG